MNDDFIRQARADWRGQEIGAAHAVERLRRGRWTPHALLGLDIAGSVLMAFLGLWLAWSAANAGRYQLLLLISAAMLLVSAPAVVAASVLARRPALRWEDETPECVLRIGLRRAHASLKVLRVGRWQIVALAAFVALLWIVEATGYLHARDFLLFYTPICLFSAILWEIWSRWRRARLERERAIYARLLAEYGDAD